MRGSPLVERAGIVGAAVLLVLTLVFLAVWHLHWLQVFAAPVMPASPLLPVHVDVPAGVDADFRAWIAAVRAAGGRCIDENPNFEDSSLLLVAPHAGKIPGDPVDGLFTGGHVMHGHDNTNVVCDALDATLTERLGVLLDRGLRLGQMPAPPDAGHWRSVDEPTYADQCLCLRAGLCWYRQAAAETSSAADGGARGAPGRQPLDALDALAAALGPGAEYRWMTWISALRDAAYLKAQLAGTIDAGRLARWRSDGDWRMTLLAHIEYERRRVILAAARQLAGSPWASGEFRPMFDDARSVVANWWDVPMCCSLCCQALVQEGGAITAGTPVGNYGARLLDQPLRMLARHRFALLASEVAETWMRTGMAPDPASLDLAAGPDRPALKLDQHYQRWDWKITCIPDQGGQFPETWSYLECQGRGYREFPDDLPGPAFAWNGSQLLMRFDRPIDHPHFHPVPIGLAMPGQ